MNSAPLKNQPLDAVPVSPPKQFRRPRLEVPGGEGVSRRNGRAAFFPWCRRLACGKVPSRRAACTTVKWGSSLLNGQGGEEGFVFLALGVLLVLEGLEPLVQGVDVVLLVVELLQVTLVGRSLLRHLPQVLP